MKYIYSEAVQKQLDGIDMILSGIQSQAYEIIINNPQLKPCDVARQMQSMEEPYYKLKTDILLNAPMRIELTIQEAIDAGIYKTDERNDINAN